MKLTLKRSVAVLALGVVAMGMTACGSGSGSTSYFKTVTVAPVGTIADSVSTVLASGNTSDAAVTVSLQSTPYAGTTGASPITIKSSTIRYAKTGNSPAAAPATLPDQSGPAGPIPAGSTVAFAFTPASGIFKDNLVTTQGFPQGSGQKWQYYVTYHFSAREDYTNTDVNFSVPGGAITFQ